MGINAKVLPALEPGETYTDQDFLLVQTNTGSDGQTTADIERMFTMKREDDEERWGFKTVTSMTKMSREDAMILAQAYAESHDIPVIYEQHD